MPSDDNWTRVHEFLVQRFNSQEPFTRTELFSVTSWKGQSPNTYWSKQISQFLIAVGRDTYRVGEAFRRVYAWERFQRHASQMRPVVSQYTSLTYDSVLIYEFFMPLSNEEHLRASLDALFYRDTIEQRLRMANRAALGSHFAQEPGESEDAYIVRTAEWISSKFGGYSISHVSGRFKASALSTFQAAATLQANGGRYLVDETTAIVRFIFPCGLPFERKPPLTTTHFEEVGSEEPPADAHAEAAQIRWFFGLLFVQNIVQVVNGEAEIWMVESGMRHRLHIWRVESERDGFAEAGR